MKTIIRTAASLVVASSLALTATAHPGHGEPGPTHFITEPVHLLPLVAVAGSLTLCDWLMFGRRNKRHV